MSLEGLLEEFGLADILQLIYYQKKTGMLNVVSGSDEVIISLVNGNITGLESKNRLEETKLGRVLIKKGLISAENLEAAMEIQKKENVKLGIIFLRRGLVSQDVLIESIQNQITESIARLFSWTQGRYKFLPREVSTDDELPVSIDVQHLLMDGLRTVDEWALIDGKLDLNSVFKIKEEPQQGQLNETETEILSMVDGESDVSTIISVSQCGDFETSKALISLKEHGIIAPVEITPYLEATSPVKISERTVKTATFSLLLLIFVFSLIGVFFDMKFFSNVSNVSQLERTKSRIDVFRAIHGSYPERIDEIADADADDPWGHPYVYRPEDDGFIVFSKGPDGIEGTGDDVY
jgi:hypothetical protein